MSVRPIVLLALLSPAAHATFVPPAAECNARWLPDACTEAVASAQYVPYASSQGCTGGAQPGSVALANYLMAAFPGASSYGIYSCRPVQGGVAWSLHAEGRAIDLMIPMDWSQPYGANNAIGDPVAAFLMEHAEEIGIQSFTWDRTIFYGDDPSPKHHCISIENGHWDHLHIELSWDAALMLTPWFNPPYEPPDAAANPNPPLPALTPVGPDARLQLLGPSRAFDTRQDLTSTRVQRANGSFTGPLGGGVNTLTTWSGLGLPADASGAWLNLTGVSGAGFLSVYPAGQPTPDASSVNLSCRQPTRANAAPVGFGPGGAVAAYASSAMQAIADVSGAFAPTGAGLAVGAPTRLLDTRPGSPMLPGEVRVVPVSCAAVGASCTPGTEVGAMATVTVVEAQSPGFLTVFPCGQAVPDASVVNFEAGATVANTALTPLGGGALCVYAFGTADVLVDVTGVVSDTAPTRYQPVAPVRVLDTRQANSRYIGRVGAGQTLRLPVQSLPGAPAQARAATLNLTAVDADGSGYFTVYPCDTARPDTSSLNVGRPDATAAVTTSGLGPTGDVCVYASSRAHLLVDLLGVWFEPPPPVLPTQDPEPTDTYGAPDDPPAEPDGAPSDPGDPQDPTAPGDPSSPGDGDPSDPDAPVDPFDGATLTPGGGGGCGCDAPAAPRAAAGALALLALLRRARRRR